ncbi:MAG TPA: sigma-70 family RNA polymerase sigma factor [Holophagaceae bacterium]|nr:sigma-70 family RNA polymerase sigma factor [Holophagaceae bacterium]
MDLPSQTASTTARAAVLLALRERIVAFAASRYARESAEDLAQEVLVVLHEKYGHLDRMEDLVPLAFQILRFKLAAARRKAFRHGEHSQVAPEDLPLASDEPTPESAYEKRQQLERLSGALARLGDRCREIFRLKLQGKAFAEIQVIMGAGNLNTIYTWDHRCRKQLLEEMGGRWEP